MDPSYAENEAKYAQIKKEILGEESSEDDDEARVLARRILPGLAG